MDTVPEWVNPEFGKNIKTSGTKLRAFSGKLNGVPVSVWVLKTKGRVYKDRYGKISFDWTIHPMFEGGKWVVRSRMSFAPATSGSFANDKYKEFIDNDMISGKANNVVFGIKEYILEGEPEESNPAREVNKVISKHASDLKEARKFWKKQLAEAKKQMIALEVNMDRKIIAREILMAAKDILGRSSFSVGDVVVVKNKGREIEDVVEDMNLKRGKWVYKLEKTKDLIPQEQLKWASQSKVAAGEGQMDNIAQALVEVAEMLAGGISKTAASRPWNPRVMKEWIKTARAPVNALGHEWKKASTALKDAERNLNDKRAIYSSLTDARDALDAVADYHRMAASKALGALQYIDQLEE